MLAIIDYGVGNLFSLKSSLEAIGEKAFITGNVNEIKAAERLILPGVGAFGDAALRLKEKGISSVIAEEAKNGKLILGICLGMQLLFERSFEYGEYKGLGIIEGEIRPISGVIPKELKVPHIGWNRLDFKNGESKLFKYIKNGDYVYFVHSYYATNCKKNVIATAEYGAELTAAVADGNVFGCQFHPEKSGSVGLNILKAFCEMKY